MGFAHELKASTGRQRLASKEALEILAVVTPQEIKLFLGFDAFGKDFHAKTQAQNHDASGEHSVIEVGDVFHKGTCH